MSTGYRYTHKLRPAEAVLRLEIRDLGRRARLPAQAAAAAARYGFVLGGQPPPTGLRHLMLVWDRPLDDAVLDTVRRRLQGDVDSASVVFAYPDEKASRAAVPAIDAVKAATGDRLNVVRPDRRAEGGPFVSNDKLVQTMIAETVRVRYEPVPRADRLPTGLADNVRPFFDRAARLIARHEMWSRGPTDGCIAVRCPDGLVVTATQTSKAPLEADRLVLVHGYDETTDTITYSGPALPSADCVELMVLASQRPDLGAFVHTHASELITRNPHFQGGLRLGIRVSGEPALGHELARLLPAAQPSLVVLEEHGEIFAGESADDEFFTWFATVCADAAQTLG